MNAQPAGTKASLSWDLGHGACRTSCLAMLRKIEHLREYMFCKFCPNKPYTIMITCLVSSSGVCL